MLTLPNDTHTPFHNEGGKEAHPKLPVEVAGAG
jgi:hypothetical protein